MVDFNLKSLNALGNPEVGRLLVPANNITRAVEQRILRNNKEERKEIQGIVHDLLTTQKEGFRSIDKLHALKDVAPENATSGTTETAMQFKDFLKVAKMTTILNAKQIAKHLSKGTEVAKEKIDQVITQVASMLSNVGAATPDINQEIKVQSEQDSPEINIQPQEQVTQSLDEIIAPLKQIAYHGELTNELLHKQIATVNDATFNEKFQAEDREKDNLEVLTDSIAETSALATTSNEEKLDELNDDFKKALVKNAEDSDGGSIGLIEGIKMKIGMALAGAGATIAGALTTALAGAAALAIGGVIGTKINDFFAKKFGSDSWLTDWAMDKKKEEIVVSKEDMTDKKKLIEAISKLDAQINEKKSEKMSWLFGASQEDKVEINYKEGQKRILEKRLQTQINTERANKGLEQKEIASLKDTYKKPAEENHKIFEAIQKGKSVVSQGTETAKKLKETVANYAPDMDEVKKKAQRLLDNTPGVKEFTSVGKKAVETSKKVYQDVKTKKPLRETMKKEVKAMQPKVEVNVPPNVNKTVVVPQRTPRRSHVDDPGVAYQKGGRG